MSENIERFASLMSNRMQSTANAAIPNTLELGKITANMALVPDNFRVPIPKGDYMVNLRLTGPMETTETEHKHSGGAHAQSTGDGVHSHEGGKHKHGLPESHRGLRPGDRVLIAWCGNEAVVIAIVVSS